MPITRKKMKNLKIAREVIVACQALLCSVCSPSTRIDRMLKFSLASPLLCLLAISLSLATTGCEDVEKSEPFEFAPSAFVTPTSAERATYEAAIARNVATAATLPLAEDEPIFAFLEQILTDRPEVSDVWLEFDPAYAGRPIFFWVLRGPSGLLGATFPESAYPTRDLQSFDGKAGYWGYELVEQTRESGDITTAEYVAPVVKAGVTVGILYTSFGPLAPKQ
jgi:hypothetical protein